MSGGQRGRDPFEPEATGEPPDKGCELALRGEADRVRCRSVRSRRLAEAQRQHAAEQRRAAERLRQQAVALRRRVARLRYEWEHGDPPS